MKATGIVRRIDDLGRVVIPKEIRRVLHIKEGDPLEIYTDREGEVIFKKYSPMGELGSFSLQYAETLHKTCGLSVVITDRDGVVAAAGVPKREFSDRRVSSGVERLLEGRAFYRLQNGGKHIGVTDDDSVYFISGAMPIITGGDVAGCVMSVIKDESERPEGELEEKLIRTAAGFLSKQMEE